MADRSIYQAQFDCIEAGAKNAQEREALRRRWVPAHLLHGETRRTFGRNLHGPGNDRRNVIIADSTVNARMNAFAERQVLNLVYGQNQVLWYETSVGVYWPGSDFVARGITFGYGRYDAATGTEGPPLDGQSVWATLPPPPCPATLPAVAPPVPAQAGPAASARPAPPTADFTSTIHVCYQVLRSRVFPVHNGGLTVTISAGWHNEGSTGPRPGITDYGVSLQQKGFLWDSTISDSSFTVGRRTTMTWRHLEDDDYFLIISVPDHDPRWCLQGDISVLTFSAPRPVRSRGPILA